MQLKTIGESLNVTNTINNVISKYSALSETQGYNAYISDKLAKATASYSTEAVKAAIKQSTLNETQIKAILTKKGLKGEILETTTAELAEIAATNGMSVAQKKATVSTLGLSDAFKGLWAFMKANPILFVAAGFTAVMAGVNAYNKYQEELAEKTRTATTEVQNATDSIEEYASKYEELYTELTDANTTEERQSEIKKELLKIQQELNEAYGDECGKINLVSDAYTNQINKIKELSKEKAHQWLAGKNEGIQQATKQMEKERTYTLGLSISSYDASGQAIKELAESFKDAGIEIDPNESTGTFDIRLKANAEDADKTISEFVSKVYSLKKQFKNDPIIDDVLNTSNNAGDKVQEILGKYQQQYNQAKMYQIADSEELSKGYNDATIAVQEYNDALTSGDDSKIKESRAKLEAVKNSIDLTSDTWKSYAGIINDVFDQADTRIVDFKAELESQDGQELLGSVKGYTETELRAMADDGNNGDVMDRLLESADKYKLKIEDVISLLKELGVIIEDTGTAKGIETVSASFSDLFSSLPIDKLEEFISLVNSGTIDEKSISQYSELAEMMEQTGTSAEDAVEKVKEFAEGFNLSSDLIQGIQDSYDTLESIREEFATTKQIGIDSLQTIANQFPDLIYATTQYTQGLITAEDLMRLLEQAYYDDEEAYRYNMILKMEDDEEFWQSVAENNQEFFTALGEAYQIDTANWKSLAEAKAAIDEQLIHSLSGAWGQYFDTIIDANTGMVSVIAKMAPEDESAEYLSAYAEINKIVEAKNKLTKAAKIEVKTPDFGGIGKKNTSGSGSGSGSGSEKQAKQQEIDWIARKNEILQKQHDAIMEVANDETESYNERIAALKELIEKDKERASIAEQSAAKYQEAWNEAKSGLRDSDIAKIMNGALEIDTYDSLELEKQGITDGEAYIELLQKAMELWDLKEETQKNQNDIQKETNEHLVEEVRLREEIIKAQQESLSAQMDILESRIDLADATGKYVGAGTYKDMIAVSKEMSSVYEDQIDNLYEQLSLFDEESAEWYSIKGQIADCEQSIAQCTIQQAEWNETIKRLPIDRLQTYIDLLENIKQDLQNFTDENSVLGLNPTKEQYQQFIQINQEELDSLIKQQEKLKDILSDYEYGSEKYNDVSGEIQDIDDRISSLIQSQLEYNDAILQIPITEMENYYNNLSSAKTALENAIAEDNARGLSTTIDQYNELHNITLQQLQALSARRDALTSLLSVYDKESDKYRETQDAINSINSEMSSLVQNQYQWNQEILNIPIEKLNEINDNLNSYASILDGVISDYESAIGGVNSLLDDEIDKINELRDATEKEYEAKIKPLEDELNLLEKTNEARSVQIGLEQAQYNLEKVQKQKTTQVMRNGELVYEANQDDLRSANQDLADAQYNKIKFDLETQITNLEEERDALLEGYDDQIEKLEDIKSKWSEIANEIQRAIDIQKASDFFGDGWQDKVLSGNDQDMYDNMFELYQSALNQKDVIEEQISSNERLVDMMGEFVARYQDGSITYETAMSGINDMLKASENGFTALENLSAMMNLDNIHGLENIAASTQDQIAESAKLLEQYMQIVESNSNSVKGFETSWDEIKSSVAENVDALNNAASSMEEYLSAFTSNAEAIGQYTTTWEEMRKNIEEQVAALKKAAEALEAAQKNSSGKKYSSSGSSGSNSSSDNSSDSSKIYVNGKEYDDSEGSAAELFERYGTEDEKEEYWDYREEQINKKAETEGEAWKDAALEQLAEERKNAEKYHDGIKSGPVVKYRDISDEKMLKMATEMAIDPSRTNEVMAILQKGEIVAQPDQIANIMSNSQMIGRARGIAEEASNISNISRDTVIDCSIGELHLHEVQNPDQLAKALKQSYAIAMQQNTSKIFR